MTDTVYINTDYIKLDSLLKLAGVCMSGGEAKILISNGDVSLNSEICYIRGKKIYDGDRVRVNQKDILVKKQA